jgi:hypothetical protein
MKLRFPLTPFSWGNNTNKNMNSSSITYDGGTLSCSGITKNINLNTALGKLDAKICSFSGGLSSVALSSTDLLVSGSPLTSNGTITANIKNNAVSFNKMQQISSGILLGRSTIGTGNIETITIGGGLSLSGGVLSAGGGTGTVTSVSINSTDLSVSGSPITSVGTITLNINSEAITYGKIQTVSGSKLLGNPTGSAISPEEISLDSTLLFSGSDLGVNPDSTIQQVMVSEEGTNIGNRREINFISGANTTITVTDDGSNNRVNITIDSAGGSGGGTPGGSDGQLQYNNSSSFGGTIAGIYSTTGNLFSYIAQLATDIPLTIQGALSQSANLQNWTDDSSTVLASISSTGVFNASNISGTNSGDQTITLTGDVTGSGTSSFTATVANSAITYAKIQDVTGQRLFGRYSGSAGVGQEISIGTGLALNSSTGVLSSTGVTSIALSGSNGIGISGSPITTSGTITLSLGAITPSSVNGLTLTAQSTGFTISGGTSSKTLTLSDNATLSGTNSGNVSLSGENYLSLSGQAITVGAVNLSGTNATGTLAAARMPALTGDVTTSAGAVATTIGAQAVSYAKIQNVTGQRLVGRYSGTNGSMQEIILGTGLSLDTSTGTLTATGGGGGGASFDVLSTFISQPNVTLAATTNNFINFNGDAFSTTQNDKIFIIPCSGFIKNMFVLLSGTQPSTGALTFTLMKGSTVGTVANTLLTLTIASSTAAGTGTVYSNTVNSISVNVGDIIVVKAVNSASSASAKIINVSFLFTNS